MVHNFMFASHDYRVSGDFNINDDERLCFVFETKGNIDISCSIEEFRIYYGKKHFEALGTKVE